jgi:hypothetical protein
MAERPEVASNKKSLHDLVSMGCKFVVDGEVFANMVGLVHSLLTAAIADPDGAESKEMLTKFMEQLSAGSRPTIPEPKAKPTTVPEATA